MCRTLTIIKLPGYRSLVIFNNASVGRQASLSLRGCSVFVYFYYMDVWFSLQTLKHDLAFGQKENSKLKSQNKKAEAELAALTEVVHR